MKVLIFKARETDTKYHFELIPHYDPEAEENLPPVPFTYGKDMPLAKIRREILAILLNDYGEHPETILPYEGEVVEVG